MVRQGLSDRVKAKIADIYLASGLAHYQQNQLALAGADYENALKFADRWSPTYDRIQEQLARLTAVRR